nr:Chain C, ASP-PHE-GLU-ARG-GLU-GLY-TYR-SER-LEU [unidentified influenza virus]5NQ1_C Chain C, ASP-PHE-GLU-ARG-GLU-GLY-TYR-SER-LEU [unidentified influenza virus]5NQ1_F Chain F, ASP-PHE-GLU-ARG-GLU-GLY-TYR-SER-LEU [unidentified influenza virus]
DFEREGYSL